MRKSTWGFEKVKGVKGSSLLLTPIHFKQESTVDLTPSLYHFKVTEQNTGHLFLLFSFQFSFFLWIKLGLFLLFPFAYVFFPLITHSCFSLFESELCRTVAAKPVFVPNASTMPGTSSKNTSAISSAGFETDWHSLLAVSSLIPSRSPISRAKWGQVYV